VTQQGVILYVLDGPHAAFSDGQNHLPWSGLDLFSCELLANPADVLVQNVNKKPFERYHARKAWVKSLVRSLSSLWVDPLRRQPKCVADSNSTSLYAPVGTLLIKFAGWFRKSSAALVLTCAEHVV
jgi:hypothetical protein